MKQILKLTMAITLLLSLACPVWAKGTSAVQNTVHNLSTTNTTASQYKSDNVDEVCVFCHTPHGGSLTGPLWNHDLPANNSFTHYNSATVSGYLAGLSVSRNINDESLLCMACHDGSVAVDHLVNDPNVIAPDPIYINGNQTNVDIIAMFGKPGARIGTVPGNNVGTGDLSDDHPISFSYDQVLLDPMYTAGGAKENQLRIVGDTGNTSSALGWAGEGVRFFGTDNRVECSTCHDPHVDYISGINNPNNYSPFLIRPNTGSNLCLACHNK